METWLTRFDWCSRQSWRSPTGMSFWPAGRMREGPRLIVIHSTETVGFPGYGNGASAPHFTIDLRSGHTRQHVPLEWGSRCLAVSTGGVTDRTVNISGTIQIEVIGAVTPGYPSRYGHYDLVNRFPGDTQAQRHLGRLLAAIHEATGRALPLQFADVTWVRYPDSYGVRARQRLSSSMFAAVRGVLGHMHAPANDHGDGLLGRAISGSAPDMQKVLNYARASIPSMPGDADMPKGALLIITADALNCRSGPGTQHDVVGVGTRGMVLQATGRSSGPWVEAQSPYQIEHGMTAWWHSGFLTRKTAADPPEPNEVDRRIQELLLTFGYSLRPFGADGFWGPVTEAVADRYASDAGYQGSINDRRTLLTHMEMTMKAILDHINARTTVTLNERSAGLTGNAVGRRLDLDQSINLLMILGANAWIDAREAKAHAAASEAALEALASQTGGVDVQAVLEAARAGAAKALTESKFTGQLTLATEDEETA